MSGRRSTSWSRWAVPALIVALFFFLWPAARAGAERSVIWLLRPLAAAGAWVRSLPPDAGERELRRERDDLRRQLARVSLQLAEANQRLTVNEVVTGLNQFSQASKHRLVVSAVLAVSPDPGIRGLTLDKGQADGLRPGLAVVADNGLMIGKLVEVRQAASSVVLVTDRQSILAGRVQNDSQSLGVVRGERGLALRMEFIPKNDSVLPGQPVVTAGSEPGIPADLVIGTIAELSIRAGELFQNATVTSPVDFQRLRVVAVVLP